MLCGICVCVGGIDLDDLWMLRGSCANVVWNRCGCCVEHVRMLC